MPAFMEETIDVFFAGVRDAFHEVMTDRDERVDTKCTRYQDCAFHRKQGHVAVQIATRAVNGMFMQVLGTIRCRYSTTTFVRCTSMS